LARPRGEARFIANLSTCRRVNLDTSALIYYLEDRRPYADLMEAVFRRVSSGELEAVVSSIAQMELLVRPIRERDLEVVGEVIEFTEQTANLTVVDVSRAVAMQAAVIRAEGLGVPDSLIVATGAVAECDATITNDGGWRRVVEALRRRPPLMRGEVRLSMPKVVLLNDYVDG
jgi:predicted nucleic acid-binding protein